MGTEIRESDIARFWSKVNKTKKCWVWVGRIGTHGYGVFSIARKNFRAHRFSYSIIHGDLNGLSVLHKCDNPACVNPDHLFLGTQNDNIKDMVAKGRNPTSKLTIEVVSEIKKDIRSGAKVKDVAKKYGISLGMSSLIKNGHSWKEIN